MRAGPCDFSAGGSGNSRRGPTGRARAPAPSDGDVRPPGRAVVRASRVGLSPGVSGECAWSILASTRVGCRVHLAECVGCDQRVDLRRGHRGVPEQLLHDPHVGAALRAGGSRTSAAGCAATRSPRCRRARRRPGCTCHAACRDIRRPRTPRNSAGVARPPRREQRTRPHEVRVERRARVAAERHDALLAALAEQSHDLARRRRSSTFSDTASETRAPVA